VLIGEILRRGERHASRSLTGGKRLFRLFRYDDSRPPLRLAGDEYRLRMARRVGLKAQEKVRFMSQDQLGFLSPDDAAPNSAANGARKPDTRPVAPAVAALTTADREQLEREVAAIERASAALRRAEPQLESWTDFPATAVQKPRPVWLLIGVLWLSTALVTVGAVFAISALVGQY
jgi:hypothetical protein